MNDMFAYRPLLTTSLESFIRDKEQTMSPDMPLATDFLDRVRTFATTGKLLRGSALCFSYALCSGQQPTDAVIKAAMAQELTHSALLMHDDVMDQDDTRRGQPAMHRQYEALAVQQHLSHAAHFGESMAVCGGDAAFFLAFELLSEAITQVKPPVAKMITRLFTHEFASVSAGQMQDIYMEVSPAMPTRQAIYDLMKTKTAAYTLALPLALGALFARQPAATVQTLQTIGTLAGIIFQIRDDELGSLSTAAQLGKPVGSDIRQGKKTLLAYYLFKRCDAGDRTRLATIFGNPKATARDITTVQNLARQYDIQKLLNRDIIRLRTQASTQIATLAIPDHAKAEVDALVRFCATRQV